VRKPQRVVTFPLAPHPQAIFMNRSFRAVRLENGIWSVGCNPRRAGDSAPCRALEHAEAIEFSHAKVGRGIPTAPGLERAHTSVVSRK